jgi:hypothetical protein
MNKINQLKENIRIIYNNPRYIRAAMLDFTGALLLIITVIGGFFCISVVKSLRLTDQVSTCQSAQVWDNTYLIETEPLFNLAILTMMLFIIMLVAIIWFIPRGE